MPANLRRLRSVIRRPSNPCAPASSAPAPRHAFILRPQSRTAGWLRPAILRPLEHPSNSNARLPTCVPKPLAPLCPPSQHARDSLLRLRVPTNQRGRTSHHVHLSRHTTAGPTRPLAIASQRVPTSLLRQPDPMSRNAPTCRVPDNPVRRAHPKAIPAAAIPVRSTLWYAPRLPFSRVPRSTRTKPINFTPGNSNVPLRHRVRTRASSKAGLLRTVRNPVTRRTTKNNVRISV